MLAVHAGYVSQGIEYLQMDPNGGSAKMRWVDPKPEDYNAFICALNAWRYFKG